MGTALPKIKIGNQRVVAAEYPEYRMSALFFVYKVRWNALIWAAILCSRTVDRFSVQRRTSTKSRWRTARGGLSSGDEQGFQELSEVHTFSFQMSKIQVLTNFSAR